MFSGDQTINGTLSFPTAPAAPVLFTTTTGFLRIFSIADATGRAVKSATPPGGIAQVRYLCKRIRAQGSEQRIIVGRWGLPSGHTERTCRRLRELRVSHVGATLLDSRDEILSLLSGPRAAQSEAAAAPR